MSVKVAINGMGRIGRAILKLLIEESSFEVVALNDLVNADNLAKVIDGDLVKVMSWYDNEWGYANQMVREAEAISRDINPSSAPALVQG